MGPLGSSIAVGESKGCKAEMDSQIVASQVCVVVPETVSKLLDLPRSLSGTAGENIEGLSKTGTIGSLVAERESDDPIHISQVCGIAIEKDLSEDIHLPSSSKKHENEMAANSAMGPDAFLVAVDESEGSEAQVSGILRGGDSSEDIHLPSSSKVSQEEKDEDSDIAPAADQVPLEESKGSEAQVEKDEDSSDIAPAADQGPVEESKGYEAQVCGIVPGSISEHLDLPHSLSATGGENIEGFSKTGPSDSLVAIEESNGSKQEMNSSLVGKILPDNVPENIDLPVCLSATESENVEDPSNKGPVDSSEAVDESKPTEVEGL